MKISTVLPQTQNEALSYRELSALTGLSEREVRAQIRQERREGIPILTSREYGRSGVWLWNKTDMKEFDRCYKTIVRIGMDYLETARKMKEGQT
jgi:biotin operon repressor